jgi:hypothetical protein
VAAILGMLFLQQLFFELLPDLLLALAAPRSRKTPGQRADELPISFPGKNELHL